MIDALRERRRTRRRQRDADDDREILHILTTRGPAHAWSIRQDATFRSARVHRALDRLIATGLVKEVSSVADLTSPQRVHREIIARRIITDAIRERRGFTPGQRATLAIHELRAHGLFDHTCDDLCGTEDDDHHTCHEAGYDCSAGGCECMCHGYTNDEEPAVVDGSEQHG
ncbi:MAG TPA: hypothetical protein VFM55_19270 [Micromonosporaceae bacterium]|nr:hypothetical protein [Micromonosporaceae bacterium]